MDGYYFAGFSMIIGGFYTIYKIGKRRFNRTNAAGVQLFKNYRTAVWVTFMEKLFFLLAKLMVIAGICVLAWGYRANHINDKPFPPPVRR